MQVFVAEVNSENDEQNQKRTIEERGIVVEDRDSSKCGMQGDF